MVAAKLDQSRVFVTKFRRNRSTLKGGSADQRQTDRQTHRHTNSAENKGPSGMQSGQHQQTELQKMADINVDPPLHISVKTQHHNAALQLALKCSTTKACRLITRTPIKSTTNCNCCRASDWCLSETGGMAASMCMLLTCNSAVYYTRVLYLLNDIFGRPFVKRFAICYQSVVGLSVLSVRNVGVLWPNGWIDQDETWHGGRTRPRPHCVRWRPSCP